MKRILMVIFLGMFCLQGCDMTVNTAYQRTHMPEIVNETGTKVDAILIFKAEDDGVKRLYHVRLPVHSSVPIWLDNHSGLAYVIGSHDNVVDRVLVTKAGACVGGLSKFRSKDSSAYSTTLPINEVGTFLTACPALINVSGSELEGMRKTSGFYPHNATCLMLGENGILTPIRESELPWYNPTSLEYASPGLVSICSDPNAPEKEALFQ